MSSSWTVQYHQRVLATDPIAYWMLDEKSGTVAYDLVSGRVAGAQNGTHSGVTLGQDGIGDGRTSPFYDGANDHTNIYSAALAAAFSGSEGSMMTWARVSGAGVWTDGAVRLVIQIGDVGGTNSVRLGKAAANNTLYGQYVANSVVETRFITSTSLLWHNLAITWSASADEVKVYLAGVQQGATLTLLGAWGGVLSAVRTNVGADGNFPSAVWDGTIAHCAVWDKVLSADQLADLAVVE